MSRTEHSDDSTKCLNKSMRRGFERTGTKGAEAAVDRISEKMLHEGTPHGNAKLAYSEIIVILNPVSFFLRNDFIYTYAICDILPDFLCCQPIESSQPAVVADAS